MTDEDDEPRERIFEMEEAFVPPQCERCKKKRPRSVLIKRMIGKPMTLAFLCRSCGDAVKQQASYMADEIRKKLRDQGSEVEGGA